MSNRFHQKYHRHNHHTDGTIGEPDASRDPIASTLDPFKGSFVLAGSLSSYAPLSAWAGYFNSNNIGVYVYGGNVGIAARSLTGDIGDIDIDNFGNTNMVWPHFTNGYLALSGQGNALITQSLSAGSIWTNTLYATSAVILVTDMYISELSGFVVKGTDWRTTVPSSINPNIEPLVFLEGIGLSGTSWLSIVGDIKTVNNLIAEGKVYSDSGDSDDWSSAYTTTNANSSWWEANATDIMAVAAASGGWNSTETTVNANSATWNTATQPTQISGLSLSALGYVTNEPTGFPDITTSVFGFDNASRTYTISAIGSEFSNYQLGIKYTYTTPQSAQIPDTEGTWYIYFDQGILNVSNVSSDLSSIVKTKVMTSIVYWDATNNEHIYLAEERHGVTMDGVTHLYLHQTEGTKWISGISMDSFDVDGNGDDDSSAMFNVNTGQIADEDLYITTAAVSSTSIPIFYKDGASGYWRRDLASSIAPIKNAVAGDNRAAWNEYTGGVWTQTEVANLNFVLVHIFATNDANQPIISIQGQADYNNIITAREGATVELNNLVTTGLPFKEFIPIGTIIYQTATAYNNAVKSRVRSTDDGDDYVDFRQFTLASTGSVNNHSNLAGLTNDDHLQYARVDGTRAFTDTITGYGDALFSGMISAGCGTSDDWCSAFTTINSTSAVWVSGGGTIQGTDGNTYNIRANDDGIVISGDPRGESSVDLQTNRANASEVASGTVSTIGGGTSNTASANYSTIVGGIANIASGQYASIGGGYVNSATGMGTTVGGGCLNSASNYNSTIGGGQYNTAVGHYSTIGGGLSSTVFGNWSIVGGGNCNYINAAAAAIGGGCCNCVSGNTAIIGGGACNTITDKSATIAGGYRNVADIEYSAILGGCSNDINSQALAMIIGSTITASLSNATHVNRLLITDIPIVSSGLPSGTVWSNGGILEIIS